MFNSVALDVVIGLVFIYLLYSLLATVISEIIATNLGLRARNLKVAVNRMLTDEKERKYDKHWSVNILKRFVHTVGRVLDSINFMKNPKNRVLDDFYNHPEIKYLGNTGLFSSPSSFKAVSFSKTLLQVISDNKAPTSELISTRLEEMVREAEAARNIQDKNQTEGKGKYFDLDTARYLLNLWQEAGADVAKFKLQLENWFDRTMEHATEWYKRNIQVILLFIGFGMAMFFNADSFVIIGKLSNDKEARKQMVELASAYVENNPAPNKDNPGVATDYSQEKLDSLLKVKKVLEEDVANANQILGLGGWLPDSVVVKVDTVFGQVIYPLNIEAGVLKCKSIAALDTVRKGFKENVPLQNVAQIDTAIVMEEVLQDTTVALAGQNNNPTITKQIISHELLTTYIRFSFLDKVGYLLKLAWAHFFGFLLTAIAVSLGAPFWFDLLNKLMRLRSSEKQDTDTPKTSIPQPGVNAPIAVNVNTSSNGSQEAVG